MNGEYFKIETRTKNRFLIVSVYLAVIVILYGGFSRKIFYDLGVCWLLGSVFIYCISENRIKTAIITGIVFLVGLYAPWLWRLDGALCFTLIPFPIFYPAIGAILIRWLADYSPVGVWVVMPILPFIAAVLFNLFSTNYQKYFLIFLLIFLSIFTISDLFKEKRFYQIDQGNPISYEYGISGTIENFFPKQFISGPDINRPYVIRSLINGARTDSSRRGIILVDHDQWFQLPDQVKENNWQQPLPWSENEFVGDQYWRASISHDGMLVSNIGGELLPRGVVKLAYPSIFPSKVKVLATQDKDILFLSDSDFFVNRLLNYQLSLIGEILKAGNNTILLHLANLFFIIATILLIFNKPGHLIAIVGILFAALAFSSANHENARYVGPVFDPHDPARAWAVKRVLIDNGVKLKIEENGPTVLILASGESAHPKTEKLIVAEPRSKIFLNNQTILINDTPMGSKDGIPDARQVSINGVINGPKVDISGVQIIGTGSPAKIPKDIWYQFLPH